MQSFHTGLPRIRVLSPPITYDTGAECTYNHLGPAFIKYEGVTYEATYRDLPPHQDLRLSDPPNSCWYEPSVEYRLKITKPEGTETYRFNAVEFSDILNPEDAPAGAVLLDIPSAVREPLIAAFECGCYGIVGACCCYAVGYT